MVLAKNLSPALRQDDTLAHLRRRTSSRCCASPPATRAVSSSSCWSALPRARSADHIEGRDFEMSASIGYVLARRSAAKRRRAAARCQLALYKAKTTGPAAKPSSSSRDACDASSARPRGRSPPRRRQGGESSCSISRSSTSRMTAMHGYEALIRWRHRPAAWSRRSISFPWQRNTGLIVEIGRRCILEAARQIQAWDATGRRMRAGRRQRLAGSSPRMACSTISRMR